MRYSSALVLSTLAVGQAAASHNARHASFHARRHESKRGADEVNWANVAYDFSGVDFNTVDYGNGAKTSVAAPAVPAASSPPEVKSSAAAYVPTEPKNTPAPVPDAPSSTAKQATSTTAQAPAKSSQASSGGDTVGDLVGDIASFVSKLGVATGTTNLKAFTAGGIWVGDDGSYKATFTNDGDKTVALFCWRKETMWINATPPTLSVTLQAGDKVTVSIDEGYSGGCGAAFEDSNLTDGLLNESILEFTAKSGPGEGCFDVSREINMKGALMSVKGSKCTSGVQGDQLSCTFVCTNGSTKCGKKGEYDIAVGASTKSPDGPCMVGEYDGAPSGGCLMSGPGEHMQVTIFGSRDWPADA